jgi:protein involved in polysaccharide export with SLBB domain
MSVLSSRFLAMISGLMLSAVALSAEPYRLGEGDSLRLVLPADPDLSDTYRLGQQGRIALPLGREVHLEDLTIEEATATVAAALSERINDPAVALELVERRPFFVLGDVERPGAYPHMPDLTLGTAIAIAGGMRRLAADDLNAGLSSIRAGEDMDRAAVQLAAARLRAARIAAELEGDPDFDVPEALPGLDSRVYDRLVADEREAARVSLRSHLDRMSLLQAQLDEVVSQVSRLEENLGLVRARLARMDETAMARQDLLDSGLISAARQEQIEALRAQVQGELLQVSVLLDQAREKRLDLELRMSDEPGQRRVQLLTDAAQTRVEIVTLRRSLGASRDILALTDPAGAAREMGVSFTIMRAGETIEVSGGLAAPLRPGDLLVVEVARAPLWREDW